MEAVEPQRRVLTLLKSMSRMLGGKPTDCSDCAGLCCREFDVNAIKRSDADRLGEVLGLEEAHALISWDPASEYGNMIMTASRNPVTGEIGVVCPLQVDGDCSVHEHRPDTCRKFRVGEPRCEKLKEWRV